MIGCKKIRIKGKTSNLYIYSGDLLKKDELLDYLLKNIPCKEKNGCAGFKNKDVLREHLSWYIFNSGYDTKIFPFVLDAKNILMIIKSTLDKCTLTVDTAVLDIFIFPTYNIFIKEKMDGVAGYTSYKNTILIYINPVDNWKIALRETICHEFAHAITLNYNERKSVLDDIIFEGAAEHFREYIVNGGKSQWSSSITKEKAKKILLDIKNKLNSKNYKISQELFFGTGKYTLWAGYAIGYYLIEYYLKNKEKINWKNIFMTLPRKIFDEIKNDFLGLETI